MAPFEKNNKVQWKWLGRWIQGHVVDIYTQSVTVELKGKKIKRNGTLENPAYLVESTAGNRALKLQSELEKSESKGSIKKTPKMFES